MRFPLSLAMILAGAALASTPALATQCVKVTFVDDKGAVVLDAVGLMLDGAPVTGLVTPPFATRNVGEQTPCPQDLVNKMQELFNASCLTEDRRKKAAGNAGGSIDLINKRCGDMAQALRDNPKP